MKKLTLFHPCLILFCQILTIISVHLVEADANMTIPEADANMTIPEADANMTIPGQLSAVILPPEDALSLLKKALKCVQDRTGLDLFSAMENEMATFEQIFGLPKVHGKTLTIPEIESLVNKIPEKLNDFFECAQLAYPISDKKECCSANPKIPSDCVQFCGANEAKIDEELVEKCFPFANEIKQCFDAPAPAPANVQVLASVGCDLLPPACSGAVYGGLKVGMLGAATGNPAVAGIGFGGAGLTALGCFIGAAVSCK